MLCQTGQLVRRHPHPRHRRPARRHRRPARRQGHLPRRRRRAPRGPPHHPGELAGPAAEERPRRRPGRGVRRPRPRLQRRRAALAPSGRTRPAWSPTRPRSIRTFRVAAISTLGTKRGRGRGAFIDSVLGAHRRLLRRSPAGPASAWSAAPPKLRPGTQPRRTAGADHSRPSLGSTDYSSQDGTEPVDVPATARASGGSQSSGWPDETPDRGVHVGRDPEWLPH